MVFGTDMHRRRGARYRARAPLPAYRTAVAAGLCDDQGARARLGARAGATAYAGAHLADGHGRLNSASPAPKMHAELLMPRSVRSRSALARHFQQLGGGKRANDLKAVRARAEDNAAPFGLRPHARYVPGV